MIDVLAQTTQLTQTQQWGLVGIIFAIFVGSFYLILRILKTYDRSIENTIKPYERRMAVQEHENLVLKRENRVCTRRLAYIVAEMANSGVRVSGESWARAEAEEPPVPALTLEENGERGN